ncbi:hypothetical protein KQX54_003527 [Cotesia glomerata]|uniref:Uncharacterized protein n=1 Tax=Cotesia glomerata TaxID=32391 RepID=A0AAV7IHZ2_COTGL|nr:hypothetical protein KQX54_003527 [Cotesia glomerata]
MSGWVKNRGEKSRWIQHEPKGLSDAATMREGEIREIKQIGLFLFTRQENRRLTSNDRDREQRLTVKKHPMKKLSLESLFSGSTARAHGFL